MKRSRFTEEQIIGILLNRWACPDCDRRHIDRLAIRQAIGVRGA